MNRRQHLDQIIGEIIPQAKLRKVAVNSQIDQLLWLFDTGSLEHPLPHDIAQRVMDTPPFWSFCWASGSVFSQYISTHRDHFKDQVIVDFGSGSGVVGIAAAMMGARTVYCLDCDIDALAACQLNADLNGVSVKCIESIDEVNEPVDIVLAADIFYDQDNLNLLSDIESMTPHVLIADSRLKRQPTADYEAIYHAESQTLPEIGEDLLYNQVTIYRYNGATKSTT